MLALTRPEKKILFAVLSILTGMCTVAFFLHRNSNRLIDSSERIEHVEEFQFHAQEILRMSVDIETGVRGYVMTGDESYMQPANKAIAHIFLHTEELSSMATTSAEQAKRIEDLRQYLDEKSNISMRIVEIRRQKGMKEAIDYIAEGQEKKLMDQIRNTTGSILEEEGAQLARLKEKHTNAISNFAITFYFMLLKISATVITVVVLLVLYIRRRNKSEVMLKESHDLFQNVLDHSASIISIKDLSGRYLLINQAFENMFGIEKEEVKGKTAYDFFEKEASDHIRNTDFEVIRLQQQKKVEEIVTKDGHKIHFASVKFPLLDINQIPYAICSISTDDTEKMHSEILHREQMARIVDLFNNAPCGYQATDKNGLIIEMNDTLLKWLGYTRDEVIGKMPVKYIFSSESQQQLNYYFPRLRSGEIKSIFDVQVNYVRKDGSKISIVANSIAHYDENDQFLYTRTSVFDISYRKRAEGVATQN